MTPMARLLLALLLPLLWSSPTLSWALDRTELFVLTRDAEVSFRQANELASSDPEKAKILYEKALYCFERIVQEGAVENGMLYYNIGNVTFRLGDLGRAILNYRKAERLIPGDMNLQHNLLFARSRCVDGINPKPQARVFQTLFFWHYDLSRYVRSVLFVILFDCIWVCAAIYLFWKKPLIRNVALVFAVLSVLPAASLAVEAYQQAHTRYGVILAKEAIARKGDSATYEPSFTEPLHAGTEFNLIEERKGWYQIELADGRRCWITSSAAGAI
jgi:tetratricopeptide (TPR) repeat protein